GTPFTVTVTAQDSDGNTITGYRGTVHFRSTDPLASLPPDYTFTAADNGVHTFTDVILRTAGSPTVTATDTVTGSITGTATVTVDQARLGTTALLEGPAAGSDSDLVITSGPWSATSNAPWLHTSSSGNGNGLATLTFDANSGATRSGTLTIA